MTDEPTGRRWYVSKKSLYIDADIPCSPVLQVVPAADFDAMKRRCEKAVGELKGMHRRAQIAEAAAMITVEQCRASSPHVNLRRALYAVAEQIQRDRAEKAEAALAAASKTIEMLTLKQILVTNKEVERLRAVVEAAKAFVETTRAWEGDSFADRSPYLTERYNATRLTLELALAALDATTAGE